MRACVHVVVVCKGGESPTPCKQLCMLAEGAADAPQLHTLAHQCRASPASPGCVRVLAAVARDARLAAVERQASQQRSDRPGVLVSKPEDVAFVSQLVAEVTQWMALGEGEGAQHRELLLPTVNSYQRLLQYQELRRPQFGAAEPPGFYVEASCRIVAAAAAAVLNASACPEPWSWLMMHCSRAYCSRLPVCWNACGRSAWMATSLSFPSPCPLILPPACMHACLPVCIFMRAQRVSGLGGRAALRLTRASPERCSQWEAAQREERIAAIHDAAGGLAGGCTADWGRYRCCLLSPPKPPAPLALTLPGPCPPPPRPQTLNSNRPPRVRRGDGSDARLRQAGGGPQLVL